MLLNSGNDYKGVRSFTSVCMNLCMSHTVQDTENVIKHYSKGAHKQAWEIDGWTTDLSCDKSGNRHKSKILSKSGGENSLKH